MMRLKIAFLVGYLVCGQLGVPSLWAASKTSAAWRTLVIDPGHGGEDEGVKSASGVTEKQLTLELANQLAKLVTRRLGWRVVLTRDKDEFLSLARRVAIANNNKADLFVSLHANADFSQQLEGIALYVLAEHSWPSSLLFPPEAPELVNWDLAQRDYLQASLTLARVIHAQALEHPRIQTRGVFAAPLLSLKGAAMPAVLIEVGFFSHPREEEKLLSADYQQLLITTIYEGILEFKRLHEK